MRVGGGGKKGAEFERRVAKEIVKAFSRLGIKQEECWRSCGSGGHEMSCGDLRMSDRLLKICPISVECKFYKRIRWERFLVPSSKRRKSWQEWQWVGQAQEGARKRDKLIPVLILKENHGPIYAVELPRSGSVEHVQLVTFADFLSYWKSSPHLNRRGEGGAI
jgi:hypothetical protein